MLLLQITIFEWLALLGMSKFAPGHANKENHSCLLLMRFSEAFVAQYMITASSTSL